MLHPPPLDPQAASAAVVTRRLRSIAEKVIETGSVLAATRQLGLKAMSDKAFGAAVKAALNDPASKILLGKARSEVLKQAVRVAGGDALTAAGSAVTAALSSSMILTILAGILVVGAAAGGLYMYSNWGKPSSDPVRPGLATAREHPSTPVALGQRALACGVKAPPPGFPYYFRGHRDRESALQDVKNNGKGRQFAITEACTPEEARQFGRYLVFFATP